MTSEATGALIDRVAKLLAPHLGPDAADAVACEVVGDITSRYVLLAQGEVEAARADLEAMDVGGKGKRVAS